MISRARSPAATRPWRSSEGKKAVSRHARWSPSAIHHSVSRALVFSAGCPSPASK
jgi:hypothetical protein